MRVILTTAYCNQKRSESAVDLVDDFGIQEELLGEEENDLSTANDAKSESQPNHCFVGCATSSSDTLPEELEHSSNDLERKLPATRREEPSLKRKLPSLESQGSLKKSAADSNDDSKKPAAKMTAGRYASDERDPPPCHEEDENTVSLVDFNDVHDHSRPTTKAVTLRNFSKALKERGLEIREQEGDGNCLFRAVSLQVYGDPSMHMDVRHQCLDHMAKDEEHFSQFVEDEDFSKYLKRKRTAGVHGNNPEIQAISELFNRPVEVFTPDNGATPLNIFQSEYKTSDVPIRLSYQDNHYDAVVDPLLPTAGLGLGLPGLQPGLADKMQMEKAVRESDQMADQADLKRVLQESHNDELQRAIKESALSVDRMYNDKALALSDMEATDFDLEQAVSPFERRYCLVSLVPSHSGHSPFRFWRVHWRPFISRRLGISWEQRRGRSVSLKVRRYSSHTHPQLLRRRRLPWRLLLLQVFLKKKFRSCRHLPARMSIRRLCKN